MGRDGVNHEDRGFVHVFGAILLSRILHLLLHGGSGYCTWYLYCTKPGEI